MTHATCAVEDRDGVCAAETQDFLCSKHRTELVMWLWDIGGISLGDSGEYCDSLLYDLDVTIYRDDKIGGNRIGFVTSSSDTSLMFNERASDAKRDLKRATDLWAYRFAEENPHLLFAPATTEDAARWMASFPNLLAGHHQAVAMHADIRERVREARRSIDRPADKVYVGVCGGFNEHTGKVCEERLFAIEGHIEVECRECETTFCVGDRQRDLLLRLRAQVVTVREAEKALKPFFGRQANIKTLRTWINRGVLTNRASTGGTPKVLVADVLKLINGGGSSGVSTCAEAA
jgi:hypothetical protein